MISPLNCGVKAGDPLGSYLSGLGYVSALGRSPSLISSFAKHILLHYRKSTIFTHTFFYSHSNIMYGRPSSFKLESSDIGNRVALAVTSS